MQFSARQMSLSKTSRFLATSSRRHPSVLCATQLCLLVALSILPAHAEVTVDGDRMTVTTANTIAQFRGPDLVRLVNRTTGEQYIRTITPLKPLVDMEMIHKPATPLHFTGWRAGRPVDGVILAAQTSMNDLTRTVWINVVHDTETQDIVVTIWGEARTETVTGVTWGIRGLDMGSGRLVIPAHGGVFANRDNAPPELTLGYPTEWEANLAIWEEHGGGIAIYSRDDQAIPKKLHLIRRGDYADLSFETEAIAPWKKAGGVPHMEWRINSYRGDWRVPASGYRNLMHFLRKPLPAEFGRAWVSKAKSVITIRGSKFDPKALDDLAMRITPQKTVLYLPDWRKAGFGLGYPDYEPREGVREFIEKAHSLGFRVMLHADMLAVSPNSEEFGRVGRYQVCDPETSRPTGYRWEQPETDRRRYAYINPASKSYRNQLVGKLRGVVEDLNPDALHLANSCLVINDDNGPIANQSFAQGCGALLRSLLTACQGLVISTDGVNEVVAPYAWLAQWKTNGPLTGHPISTFLFGDRILSYAGLDMPDSNQAPAAYISRYSRLARMGLSPPTTIDMGADPGANGSDYGRFLELARLWQDRDLIQDVPAESKNEIMKWAGVDGASAVLEKSGALTRLKVGGETKLQWIRGANAVATSLTIPGWPARSEAGLIGLDPDKDYPLEPAGDPLPVRITSLSPLVIASETQINQSFAVFDLRYKRAGDATDAEIKVETAKDWPPILAFGGTATLAESGPNSARWLTRLPATISLFFKPGLPVTAGMELRDVPIEGAAQSATKTSASNAFKSASTGSVTLGGVSKQRAIAIIPNANRRAIASWILKLPDGESTRLSFQAGLPDGVTGSVLSVFVNGEQKWKWQGDAPGWKEGTVDLSHWRGKTILLQLAVEEPDAFVADPGYWADLRFGS